MPNTSPASNQNYRFVVILVSTYLILVTNGGIFLLVVALKQIAQDFDFFISPSRADPNPTTILESMAWGFPVICTPQSGYYSTSYRYNIDANDLSKSVEVLKSLQYADEELLKKISVSAREVVVKDYNWNIFTDKILQSLKLI